VFALELRQLHDQLVLLVDARLERGEFRRGRAAPRCARLLRPRAADDPAHEGGAGNGGDHRGCSFAAHLDSSQYDMTTDDVATSFGIDGTPPYSPL
jgi:hypothetical protein